MKLISIKQVLELTAISRATLYRYMDKGTFPKPRKLDSKTIRWVESDVSNWIENLPEAT